MNVRMVNAVFEDRQQAGLRPGRQHRPFPRPPCRLRRARRRRLHDLPARRHAGLRRGGQLGVRSRRFTARVVSRPRAARHRGVRPARRGRHPRLLLPAAGPGAGRRSRRARRLVNVVRWIGHRGFRNVVLEIANEFGHGGFDHRLLRTEHGQVELIRLAGRRRPACSSPPAGWATAASPTRWPRPPISCSSTSTTRRSRTSRAESRPSRSSGSRSSATRTQKVGEAGARAAELCVTNGASWGLMAEKINQHFPFTFNGAADDPIVYAKLKELTSPSARLRHSTAARLFPAAGIPGRLADARRPGSIRTGRRHGPRKADEARALAARLGSTAASLPS